MRLIRFFYAAVLLFFATIVCSFGPAYLSAKGQAATGLGEKTNDISKGTAGILGSVASYQTGGYGAGPIAAGDLNSDGKIDLVVVNQCGSSPLTNCNGKSSVGILLGNGDGTFRTNGAYITTGYSATSVAISDVNGDGNPDLVVTNRCEVINTCSFSDGSFDVFLGNGDGTFKTPLSFDSGGESPTFVLAADVNGDGKPDLVITNSCVTDCGTDSVGQVDVFIGNGDGTFQPGVPYSSGGYEAGSIALADVNADGNLDLIVANHCALNCTGTNNLAVFIGNGDGTFLTAALTSTGALVAFALTVADVNQDGKPDVVVVDGNQDVAVLLGNGNGTFRPAESYASGGYFSVSVAVGDINGDGKPDLIVANQCETAAGCSISAQGGVGILLGNGDGTFQPATSYGSGGTIASSVVVEDLNRDGRPDVIVTDASTTGGLPGYAAVLLNGVEGPTPSLVPNMVTFGIQTTNTTSSPQNIVLSNSGEVAMNVASIVATGDFAQTNNCSGSVGTGSSCTISVSFTPTKLGKDTGSITISDNANPSMLTATLIGTGIPPIGTISPASLTFVPQLVGTTSALQEVVFYAGSNSLKFQNVSASGNFAIQNNKCVSGLNAGAHCSLEVSFTPTATGTRIGALTFVDTASNSPQVAALVGTGGTIVTTITTVASSAPVSEYNQPITLTATVVPESPGNPTGAITFYNGTTVLGTRSVAGSAASLVVPSLPAGFYPITALYGGDSNFQSSKSTVFSQAVNRATTSVSEISGPNPSSLGQVVNLTATVTGALGGTPTGVVDFYGYFEQHILLGTATLVNGHASVLTSAFPQEGNYILSAAYEGDSNFLPWVCPYRCGGLTNQQVTLAPSTTLLTSNPNPAVSKENVVLTATVVVGNGINPVGSVLFKNGTKGLATVKLVAGVAKLTTNKLPIGNNSITATYHGELKKIDASTSAVLVQIVN